MDKLYSMLSEIKEINDAYGISNEKIVELERKMENSKVCVPVIGKFSSGKSALINTILGYSKGILKEDITPETAIPTEITYALDEDGAVIVNNDGSEKRLTLDEYRRFESDANSVKVAKINLTNDSLQKIPDVMIVDMPGFESGYEVHNKAIDSYLPESMAYIIAVPADDMIIRSSIGNILKELCLHDMPICVAITKYDKTSEEEYKEKFENMKEALKRYIGDREIRYCKTSSSEGDAEEVEEFLKEIQERSQELLYMKFRQKTLVEIDSTENYLVQRKNASELFESELDEEEEKIQQKLLNFKSTVMDGKGELERELEECKTEIRDDVEIALEQTESSFITMTLNGADINESLNNTVRSAVTMSTKKRLIPVIEKYVKKVSKSMTELDIGDINVAFSVNVEDLKTKVGTSIVAAIAAGIALGPVFGAIAGIGTAIFNKLQGDKKREEAKRETREKLENVVFPRILRQVETEIEQVIKEQLMEINDTVESEINRQQDILEKAMADVRNRKKNEQIEKENLELDMNNDLIRLGELKDEL